MLFVLPAGMADTSTLTHWTDRISVPVASLGVLVASIGFGLVPYFSRGLTESGMAAHGVAFYRFTLAAIFLLPILLRNRHHLREIGWGMLAGLTMGIGWTGYVTALETIPASTVGVLYMTYPVFTMLIAWMLFADPPTRRALMASGLIFVAAVIASRPDTLSMGQLPLLAMALGAPLGFGFAICVLVHRLSRMGPLARIGSVSLGGVLGLAPLMILSAPTEIIPADRQAWLLILGIALGTALVPQLIYTVCSPIIGTSRAAVFGAVELPTMFVIAVFAFGEPLTWPQVTGCVLILSAILLVQSRTTRNVTNTIAKQ